MKKLSLFCAIGAVLLSGQAYANPKISGTVKAIIQEDSMHTVSRRESDNAVLKDTKEGRTELNGKSRLKFSGSNKINDVLTASYSLEYDLEIDRDGGDNFDSRSTYMSLDHKKYGRIRAGRMTSPENDFDIAVTVGDTTAASMLMTAFGMRTNSTIQYYSPYFGKNEGKTRIKLHYALDEDNKTERTLYTFIDGERVGKKRDIAVAQILHNNDKYGWGFAYTQAGNDFSAISAMGRYNIDARITLQALLRQADYKSGSKENAVFVSANYDLGNSMRAYGQAGRTENLFGLKDGNITSGAFGVAKDIKTSTGRATVFGELTGYKRTSYDPTEKINTTIENFGFGTGIVYKF